LAIIFPMEQYINKIPLTNTDFHKRGRENLESHSVKRELHPLKYAQALWSLLED